MAKVGQARRKTYSLTFARGKKIKGDTYSTFKTNNREYVLFFKAPNQFPSDRGMKIELYTFGLRPCVGIMHGTGCSMYVTLIASFVFKASARWSLLSRSIVGN